MQCSLFARRIAPFLSVSLLAAVVISPFCRAEILAYDTFNDYSLRQLFVQNSGVGLRGYWEPIFDSLQRADLYQIVAPGLGGACKVHIVADDSMNIAVRTLDQPITE